MLKNVNGFESPTTVESLENIADLVRIEKVRIRQEMGILCLRLNELTALNSVLKNNQVKLKHQKGELGYPFMMFLTRQWNGEAGIYFLLRWDEKPFKFLGVILWENEWKIDQENEKRMEEATLWQLRKISTAGALDFLLEALNEKFVTIPTNNPEFLKPFAATPITTTDTTDTNE